MAEEFLRNLPQVGEADLPKGSECGICQEKYGKVDPHAGGMDAPVRLPCQHIIGSDCIRKWVSPGENDKNTCPFCRYVFFSLQRGSRDPNYQRIEALYRGAIQPPGMTERDRLVARQFFRLNERLLYYKLQRAGVQLPALIDETLSAEQETALFQELVRIGAFAGLLGHMSSREYLIVWELLRRDGFVYELDNGAMGHESGWRTMTFNSWFFVPSDENIWPSGAGSLLGDV